MAGVGSLQIHEIARLPAASAYLEEQLGELKLLCENSSSFALQQQYLVRLASVEVLLGRFAAALRHLTTFTDFKRLDKRKPGAGSCASSLEDVIQAWIGKLEAMLEIVRAVAGSVGLQFHRVGRCASCPGRQMR
jgi:hypothetical protein